MYDKVSLINRSVPADLLMRNTDPYRWVLINGDDYVDEEDEYKEMAGYYIVSEDTAKILMETDEVLYSYPKYGLIVWGVTKEER